MRSGLRGAGQALIALMVVAACGSMPSTVAKTSATPSASPTAATSAIPSASPTVAAIFDDRFGFLVADAVRRESDPQPIFVLGIGEVIGFVSPDGRQLAYWAANELRVIQIAPHSSPQTLMVVKQPEYALYVAWSSDGTGLAVGVNAPVANPFPDGPPAYTALRIVDVANAKTGEIARIANANVVPIAWDRQAHLVMAYEPSSSGARGYYVIEEGGKVARTDAGPGLYIVEASRDGMNVFGHGEPASVVRVWPRGTYASGIELHAAGDESILGVGWRPGTSEVGVLFADRLELWDVGGARRTLVLPALSYASYSRNVLIFRADGRAVFLVGEAVVAVDLVGGQTQVVPWSGPFPMQGGSVRVA